MRIFNVAVRNCKKFSTYKDCSRSTSIWSRSIWHGQSHLNLLLNFKKYVWLSVKILVRISGFFAYHYESIQHTLKNSFPKRVSITGKLSTSSQQPQWACQSTDLISRNIPNVSYFLVSNRYLSVQYCFGAMWVGTTYEVSDILFSGCGSKRQENQALHLWLKLSLRGTIVLCWSCFYCTIWKQSPEV